MSENNMETTCIQLVHYFHFYDGVHLTYRHHSASAHPSKGSGSYELLHRLGYTTKYATEAEYNIGEEKT